MRRGETMDSFLELSWSPKMRKLCTTKYLSVFMLSTFSLLGFNFQKIYFSSEKFLDGTVYKLNGIVTVPRNASYVCPYYKHLSTTQNLSKKCSTCSVVFNSGWLRHSGAGKRIDSHECVFRVNTGPIGGALYHYDVGSKVTFRVLSRAAFYEYRDMLLAQKTNKTTLNEHDWTQNNETWLLAGGGLRPPRLDPLTLDLLQFAQEFPMKTIYILHNYQKDLPTYGYVFEKEVGLATIVTRTLPSTGFYMMIIPPFLCDSISLYGASPPNLCDELDEGSSDNQISQLAKKKKPYHYYKTDDPYDTQAYISECDFFKERFVKKDRGHKFQTEHAIFQRWSQYRNITFHVPNWK